MSATTTQVIPLAAAPAQTLKVTLGSQACSITVYEKQIGVANEAGTVVIMTPLFLDLYVADALIIGGVLCLNGVKIVRDAYLGFVGDLVFYDLQGAADPVSSGLGTRFILTYQPGLA